MSKEELLLQNNGFYTWLIKEMNRHHYALYNNINVTQNTRLIPLLFKVIDDYAKNNNIEPVKIMNYNIYYIDYKGYIFSIFEHISDTNFEYGCYANLKEASNIPCFINFDDIRKSNHVKSNQKKK